MSICYIPGPEKCSLMELTTHAFIKCLFCARSLLSIFFSFNYCHRHRLASKIIPIPFFKCQRNWELSKALIEMGSEPNVTINVCPFPCFLLPCWLSEILYRQRKPIHVCGSSWDPVWMSCKACTYPQTQETWSFLGRTGLKLISGKYLETPEKSSYIFSVILSVSFGEFMFDYRCLDYGLWETIVVSHRDMKLCRCQIISSYKNSRSGECFFPTTSWKHFLCVNYVF